MEAGVPTTLQEAVTYFADKQVAHDFFVTIRFPNGVACPRQGCGSADVVAIPKRKEWRCRECRRQFSVKVGTIFEASPIGFDKWLPALWLLTANRNGVSSHELGRALGVTQKTAWFMLHRLRLALKDREQQPFGGAVEADETYIGGKQRATVTTALGTKKMAHGPADGKTTVFGVLERTEDKKAKPSRVRAMVIADRKSATLLPAIYQNVLPGSVLYTDAWQAYRSAQRDYTHFYIDHAVKYVEGHVTTNRIENFWSCLKRTLHGTYICPRAFHLQAYVDEQVYRFNVRAQKDGARFVGGLKGADGRRLTYRALTTSHPLWQLKPGRVGSRQVTP
jgi:transposase-like protein